MELLGGYTMKDVEGFIFLLANIIATHNSFSFNDKAQLTCV
jgi:hypothetical protein